jgi:leucyl-tRNA synthetase
MAYYTVAHMLHGGSLTGNNHPSPFGITPEEMTREVWDFIFFGLAVPESNTISMDKLVKMRNEFQYFYPLNLRVSGKDLVQNHLTYSLYNHAAIFPKEHWPQAFRANGHLLLNSEKMSKSTGNFLTLEQCIAKYTADATRMCLADAGDSLEDANFEYKAANATILTITRCIEWSEDTLKNLGTLRVGPMNTFADKVRCAFFDWILHSRMLLDPTHVRLKRTYV